MIFTSSVIAACAGSSKPHRSPRAAEFGCLAGRTIVIAGEECICPCERRVIARNIGPFSLEMSIEVREDTGRIFECAWTSIAQQLDGPLQPGERAFIKEPVSVNWSPDDLVVVPPVRSVAIRPTVNCLPVDL